SNFAITGPENGQPSLRRTCDPTLHPPPGPVSRHRALPSVVHLCAKLEPKKDASHRPPLFKRWGTEIEPGVDVHVARKKLIAASRCDYVDSLYEGKVGDVADA